MKNNLFSVKGILTTYRHNSLRIGVVMAVCAGLLIPAAVGFVALNNIRHESLTKDLAHQLNDRTELLSFSLAHSLVDDDVTEVRQIVGAAMRDQQLVHLKVKGTVNNIDVHLENPNRTKGKLQTKKIDIKYENNVVGTLDIAIDDSSAQMEFLQDQNAFGIIIISQVGLALLFIVFILHFRLLLPLARLSRFSRELAVGHFDQSLTWSSNDEIGQLAIHMERMRKDLKISFAEQEAILDNVQVGVLMTKNGCVELANRTAETIFGYANNTMKGVDVKALYVSDQQFCAINDRAQIAISSDDGKYDEEMLLSRANGESFWARVRGSGLDPQSPEDGSIWVFEDITARKNAESEIHNLAFYDTLTSLPNRRLLLERLKQALLISKRTGKFGALLFIDLDNFKTLNDTFGHVVGDILLQKVGERLVGCVRQKDTVARLGGDEFVVLIEDMSDHMQSAAAQVKTVGDKILIALNESYQLEGHVRYSTPSIGVALFSGYEESVDELLKRADMAMYESKTAGRNTLRFFDKKMQDILMRRAALEEDLREAVQNEEFILHYQPQIVSHDRVSGVEVLVRWIHPTRGMVSPAEFIPLAEDCGLILPLGHWVMKTACKQLAVWALRPDMADMTISVNVSARQFRQPRFVEKVLQVLEQTGANPNRLKLELTESMLVEDVEDIIIKMTQLKAHGVGFSLDDFGTGYSSLSYLKRLPLDQLKIDQGFVRNILSDPNDAAIAKMVVALALSMGLSVIAEGVELDAQREYLANLGCHAYQGYLFSKPLPLDLFEVFCKKMVDKQLAIGT